VTRLNTLAAHAVKAIEQHIRETGVTACVTGAGSMFRVHMKAKPPRNYREAYLHAEEKRRLTLLLDHLFDAGCMLINSGSFALSTPMTESEVETLVAAIRSSFARIAAEA
jgi:glutamate-1-semialdehyde 2,1-aminomutase